MDARDRFKLLFGPYETPQFEYGQVLRCEVRGDVVAWGLSGGRLPWPVGKRGSAFGLVVMGSLVEAVRKEANQAVAYWWGVCSDTVTKWRRHLGVSGSNEGTSRLRHDHAMGPGVRSGLIKAQATTWDEERRQRVSKASCSRGLSPEIRAQIAAKHRGKRLSAATRRKISKAVSVSRRYWTEEEDEWVRTLPPPEVVARTGRSVKSVYWRRRLLGVSGRGDEPASPVG